MKPFAPHSFFDGRPLAVVTLLFLGLASAAWGRHGLYKDGDLVEPMPELSALDVRAGVAGSSLGAGRSSPSVSPATRQRNAAFSRYATALEAVRANALRLHELEGDARETAFAELSDRVVELHAAAREARNAFHRLGEQIEQLPLGPAALARHEASRRAMESSLRSLLLAVSRVMRGDPGAIEALAQEVEPIQTRRPVVHPREPGVRRQPGTMRALSLAEADARLPDRNPVRPFSRLASGPESPAADGIKLLSAPGVDDLAETVEVQFTAEIVALASHLGGTPLELYEYVRNEIAFQPYLGSRKGAAFTLAQKAGNDVDQASLLIALLRASGIPARYVRGTVELTPAQAMDWLGVDDPAAAGGILSPADLDGLTIVDGPVVAALRCTRVWVEAYVPYARYRGVAGDDEGKTWIPLDPAFHRRELTPGEDVLAAMGFDMEAYLAGYLATFHPQSPIELLEANIQAWLETHDPGKTVDAIRRTSRIDPLSLGLLPASLPYRVLSIGSRFAELEEHQRYKVRFHLYDGFADFFDHTVYLSDLAGRQLTIGYVGATPSDEATIESFGGIYETPPALVQVKPQLELDGTVIASSTHSIGMGRTHHSDMEFIAPSGASNAQPMVSNTIIGGNGQAIGFNTYLDRHDGLIFGPGGGSTGFLENLLHATALDYLNRVDRGLQSAGELMQVVTTQDVSEAIVENSISVTYDGGANPLTFEWSGVIVDADRRIIGGPFPVDGDSAKEIPYMKLTGYEGSTQENRVFEDRFGQDAVSTIKLLALSADLGIDVCTITTSIAADCPGLNQSASVVAAINQALALGHHVIIPESPITVGQWQGTGYIDFDPSSGAGGYIISGGISGHVVVSGGATVDAWPVYLPCEESLVRNHPDEAKAIKAYWVGEATPEENFCGDEERKIQFKGTFQVKCPDEDWVDMPFNGTTTDTAKGIADVYGTGTYNLQLLTNVFLEIKIYRVVLTRWTVIDSPLDANPNAGGGKRIFPGRQTPDDTTDRRKVKVQAQIEPVIANVPVYFKAFDVDDPYTNDAPIDANGADATDNRSAAGVALSAHMDETDASGVAEVEFSVSMQPGDNHRVGACCCDLAAVVDNDVPADNQPTIAGKPGRYTELLTVWRKLHTELDSMKAYTGNEKSGDFTDLTGTGTALTEIKGTTVALNDLSHDLDDATVENGRFDQGELVIGTAPNTVTIGPVTGNGNDFVRFPADSIAGLPFNAGALTGDGVIILLEGTITEVTKAAGKFVWTLNVTSGSPHPIPWDDLAPSGGLFGVGGGAAVLIDDADGTAQTITTSTLNIPFTIRDDDDESLLPYATNALGAIYLAAYKECYVVPVLADSGNGATVDFQNNIQPGDLSAIHDYDNEAKRRDDYWLAYMLWTCQFHEQRDYDADAERQSGFGSGRGWTSASRYGGTAVETTRDSFTGSSAGYIADGYAAWTDLLWRTMAHEIGHEFGLGHGNRTHGGGGGEALMGAASGARSREFHVNDIDLIRDRVKSPGEP